MVIMNRVLSTLLQEAMAKEIKPDSWAASSILCPATEKTKKNKDDRHISLSLLAKN